MESRNQENINCCCYKPRLSLNKTSTVIGWFLATAPDQTQMYPDRDTIASREQIGFHYLPHTRHQGGNTPWLLPARWIQQHVFVIWLFKGKSKYITKHLMYGHEGKRFCLPSPFLIWKNPFFFKFSCNVLLVFAWLRWSHVMGLQCSPNCTACFTYDTRDGWSSNSKGKGWGALCLTSGQVP